MGACAHGCIQFQQYAWPSTLISTIPLDREAPWMSALVICSWDIFLLPEGRRSFTVNYCSSSFFERVTVYHQLRNTLIIQEHIHGGTACNTKVFSFQKNIGDSCLCVLLQLVPEFGHSTKVQLGDATQKGFGLITESARPQPLVEIFPALFSHCRWPKRFSPSELRRH